MHGVENEKIVEKTENAIALEFIIPESSDFFDGHFPEFKLLPAVAQFEIVTRFSWRGDKTCCPQVCSRYVAH